MTNAPNSFQIAPGSRISIRDEEWLVRRIDHSPSGTRVFECTGLSPLVEGRSARYIENIEREYTEISLIDPAETKATSDNSPYFRDTRLFLESSIRNTCPESTHPVIGDQGAFDPLPYQLEPTELALSQPRQRILIADAVGLGKTIECGILLSELIKRGRARRILVVTVKSMLTQFQKELWSRFSLPLTRLDSAGLQKVRRKIPTNHNPFHYYDKSIISIDTLKQDGEYRTHLEGAHWDVIVIDEAHNVAERGNGGSNSLRSRTAKLLARQSDSLILLSATPHDGKRESFASLMNMLNPTAIKNPKDYGPEDIDGLFIRRFKKDVKDQISGNFPERVVHTPRVDATSAEENAYEILANLKFASIDGKRAGAKILFRTLLEKALFSSPTACSSTVKERIKKLEKRGSSDDLSDIHALKELDQALKDIPPAEFSKYQKLISLLRPGPHSIGWSPRTASDRLVIFTERIDTLEFLEQHLPKDLKLKPTQVATLHGGLSDIEQQDAVEAFGSADSPVRLLIASDVASEGINLHHQSHRLIHFDIPWSLLTFQQRNGRVDRYGQAYQPEIYYLLTETDHEKIRGDLRVLELLIEKDNEVQANIGDPSEFTGCHTSEEEETLVGQAMESENSTEALEQSFAAQAATGSDWFSDLLNAVPPSAETPNVECVPSSSNTFTPSLYEDDFSWVAHGLDALKAHSKHIIDLEKDPLTTTLDFSIPKDLARRLKKLPDEILSTASGRLVLTSDRDAINRDIIKCRGEEGTWPMLHLLWEQHPAVTWMQDKLLSRFGRQQATCIHLEHLQPGERIVVGTGIIPNRKGHPLIQRWYGVQFIHGTLKNTLTLEETIKHARLTEEHANPNLPIDTASVQALFPDTVECLQVHLSEARDTFRAETQPKIDDQLAKLRAFRDSRNAQLEIEFNESLSKGLDSTKDHKLRQKQTAQNEVQQKYDDYKRWIEETMHTEDSPSIRLFTVLGNFS